MTRKSPPGQLLARRSPAGQVELVGAAAMTLRRAGLVSLFPFKGRAAIPPTTEVVGFLAAFSVR